jgi:hypothetical protein
MVTKGWVEQQEVRSWSNNTWTVLETGMDRVEGAMGDHHLKLFVIIVNSCVLIKL